MRNPPENQHAVSHKKLAFWEKQFWGSSMMTLSFFLTKFRSCRGKLIKIKQNEKHFMKISVKELKNDLNDVNHCGLCGTSATLADSQNLATKRWIVFISGTLFLRKSLLHCRCVGRTSFKAKYTSMIFIHCCVANRTVGSILVSKESPRPALYTTWKIWKNLWDTTLGWKTK